MTMRLLLAVALLLALGSTATAQDFRKEEATLAREAKQVDVFAAGADGARVSSRIASEFARVAVKRSATDSGHRLNVRDVRALRAKSLGYGEVAIVLALYANQPRTTFRSMDQIVALRHRSPGWGQVAKTMGYESLGSVIRDVKRAGAATQRAARDDARTERFDPRHTLDHRQQVAQPQLNAP
jgi:hypothetical protein